MTSPKIIQAWRFYEGKSIRNHEEENGSMLGMEGKETKPEENPSQVGRSHW
jgi:hypothetical protein